WVFQCDSDQQIPLIELLTLWQQRKENSVILGVRAHRQDPSERLIVSGVLRIVIRIIFGVTLQDANCPFRLYPTVVLKRLLDFVPAKAFAPNIFLSILSKSNIPVQEVFVTHAPRQGGVNSINRLNLLKVCWRSFKELMNFWYHKKLWHKT